MGLDKITWPIVALVGLVLTAFVVLGLAHADTVVITNVLMLLGLGSGAGILVSVKSNVNGNLLRLIELLREAMVKLASSQPPPDDKGE